MPWQTYWHIPCGTTDGEMGRYQAKRKRREKSNQTSI
jgi:hypothetical protein